MKRFVPLIVLVLTCIAAVQGSSDSVYARRTSVASLNTFWTGTTRTTPPCRMSSGRCNAINKITFRFVPKGNRIRGKFTCAYGNLNCRNGGADDTGKIVSGRVSGNLIRLSVVVSSDVSNCYYNGEFTSPTTIHGGYSCYQGGEVIEEGIFDLTKSSGG